MASRVGVVPLGAGWLALAATAPALGRRLLGRPAVGKGRSYAARWTTSAP